MQSIIPKKQLKFKITKKSFNSYPKHWFCFLSDFNREEILKAKPKTLAYILLKDKFSIKYIPTDIIDDVCKYLDKSWFTFDILHILKYHNINFGKNFNKYFGHIPFYVLYDKYKKPYSTKNHILEVNNPIVWDIKAFSKYAETNPKYVSEIKLIDNSVVMKIGDGYIQVNNYTELKKLTINPLNLE